MNVLYLKLNFEENDDTNIQIIIFCMNHTCDKYLLLINYLKDYLSKLIS
jgi:hypothetical protein